MILRAITLAACAVASGCSVATDVPGATDRSTFTYRIDPTFTSEQADAIRVGMAFWAAELPGADVVELDAPAGGCEPGGVGDSQHCFVALAAGHEAFTANAGPMPPDGAACIGRYLGGWTAVRADLDAEMLPMVVAHEFGHRVGIWHTSHGVMSETVSAETSWHLNAKAIRLFERRGWR